MFSRAVKRVKPNIRTKRLKRRWSPRPDRKQHRAEKRDAKTIRKRRNAPVRIRRAATACTVFGFVAVLVGLLIQAEVPEFDGDAYTEMVAQLTALNGSVVWLAAVALFTSAALLKALADLLNELRRPLVGDGLG